MTNRANIRGSRARWTRTALIVGALMVASGCDHRGDVVAGPVPGELVVELTGDRGQVGAIRFVVEGDGLIELSVEDPRAVLFSREVPSGLAAAVVADGLSGPVARFPVPDVGNVAAYRVRLLEVTDREDRVATSLDGYRLTVRPDGG